MFSLTAQYLNKERNTFYHSVTTVSTFVPVIDVSFSRVVVPASKVAVQCYLSLPCGATLVYGGAREAVAIKWSIRLHGVEDALQGATNTNGRLVIPAYHLRAGTVVALSVTATLPLSLIDIDGNILGSYAEYTTVTKNVSFFVSSSPLVALIAGSDRERSVQSSILLDARSSFDPDQSFDSDQQSFDPYQPKHPFTFRWSCQVAETSPAAINISLLGLDVSRAVLEVPPGWLPAGIDLLFTVAIFGSHARQSSASVVVTTVDSLLPALVSIVTPGHDMVLAARDTLRLQALVSFEKFRSYWDYANSFDHDEIYFHWDSGGYLTDQLSSTLVVAPYTLQPNRTYRFRVVIAANQSASIDIHIASPPVEGFFVVTPEYGYALQTEFVLRCVGWTDPLQPLEYRFGYTRPTGQIAWLNAYSFMPKLTSHLPSHLHHLHGFMEVVVSVRNVEGASRTATTTVQNLPNIFDIRTCAKLSCLCVCVVCVCVCVCWFFPLGIHIQMHVCAYTCLCVCMYVIHESCTYV
jgi:hypothetical protein